MNDPKIHHRLPELRETSPFGRALRRYLLIATVLILAFLVWAADQTVKRMDLDLSIPELPTTPAAPAPSPAPSHGR